jgi:hypothetical protein
VYYAIGEGKISAMAFLFLPPHSVPYRHHSLLFSSKSSSLFSPLHHLATSSRPCRCSGHPPAVQPRSLHRRQEDYVLLSSIQSAYDDDMAILKASETSASRYAGFKILVNASGNILSMYNENCIWTDLYFVSLFLSCVFSILYFSCELGCVVVIVKDFIGGKVFIPIKLLSILLLSICWK